MKKLLICLAILLALPVGWFYWKGGHHALELVNKGSKTLAAQTAAQSLELTVNGTELRTGILWQPQGNGRVYALTDLGVYVQGDVLFLDNGRAWALPEIRGNEDLQRLIWALAAYGRITKEGDVYHITAQREDWSLQGQFTADNHITAMEVTARLPQLQCELRLNEQPQQEHALPPAVQEAMVLAIMERPTSIMEPLKALLPALMQFDDLQAEAALQVECGLLNLEETVAVAVVDHTVLLQRDGVEFRLPLPEELEDLSPTAAALGFLRTGEFRREGDLAILRMELPSKAVSELCTGLVPQLTGLGVTFQQAWAELTITDEHLQTIALGTAGTVPFLFTEIPISFRADFYLR